MAEKKTGHKHTDREMRYTTMEQEHDPGAEKWFRRPAYTTAEGAMPLYVRRVYDMLDEAALKSGFRITGIEDTRTGKAYNR